MVTNLAHPEANVTGLSLMAPDLGGKRLEMLRELRPGLSRVGILWNNANPYSKLVHHEAQRASQVLGLKVYSLEASTPIDLAPVLKGSQREGLDAILTVEDPLTFSTREQIVAFVNSAGIPTVYGLREFVEAFPRDVLRGYVDRALRKRVHLGDTCRIAPRRTR